MSAKGKPRVATATPKNIESWYLSSCIGGKR